MQNDAGYRDGEVSDANEAYNCFAWAIGRNDIRFDSSDEPCSYWPRGIEPSPYVESSLKYTVLRDLKCAIIPAWKRVA